MLDNQLITLIISTIIAQEAAAGISGTPIKQAFQPTQQGVNTLPTAYLYKIGDAPIGSPSRLDGFGDMNLTTEAGSNILTESGDILVAGNAWVHTEAQWYETTFQISALATQDPANQTQYTASDILNLIRYILQSSATIAALQAQRVGILRVMQVRNTPFVDDRQRHEYEPSFDFIVTHQQIIRTPAQVVSTEEINIIVV